MIGMTSVVEVWTAVHEIFAAQNKGIIRQTRLQLQTLKKEDLSVVEYFRQMKSVADKLASVGNHLPTYDLIDYILVGLGPQFSPLAASLTATNKAGTLKEFYAFVLTYEAIQDSQSPTVTWSSTVNTAARNTSGHHSYLSERPRSDRDNNQAQPGPQNNDRGRSRVRGQNNNNFKPRCQICKAFGHEALPRTDARPTPLIIQMHRPINGTSTPGPLITLLMILHDSLLKNAMPELIKSP